MKCWSCVVQSNKDNVSEHKAEEGFNFRKRVGESNLELQLAPIVSMATAIDDEVRDSQMRLAERQEPTNSYMGEEFTYPDWTLRRSMQLRKAPLCFMNRATVAIEDSETLKEALQSSDGK